MSASPEFYKPAPVFSPCGSPLLLQQQHGAAAGGEEVVVVAGAAWGEEYYCRTPTGGESSLKEPGTCPPAPRKPRAASAAAPCRKRLFEVEVFSLRLEELERLFFRPLPLPAPAPAPPEKRRRLA